LFAGHGVPINVKAPLSPVEESTNEQATPSPGTRRFGFLI